MAKIYRKYFKRYFVDAMSAMALGLFSSLIVGLIISQLAKIPHLGFLANFTEAILGKAPLFVNGTEGLNGVELMNAIELSGWKDGARVSLPIDGDLYYKELMARVETSRFKAVDDNQVEGTLNFGTGFVKVKNGK